MGGRITSMSRYIPKVHKVKVFLFAALWFLVLGVFLIDQNGINYLCGQNYDCRDTLSGLLGISFSALFPAASIMTILFLLKDEVFKAWLYLLLVWTSVYSLYIYSAFTISNSYHSGYTSLDNRAIVPLESQIYFILFFVVASLILIVIKSLQLHKNKK